MSGMDDDKLIKSLQGISTYLFLHGILHDPIDDAISAIEQCKRWEWAWANLYEKYCFEEESGSHNARSFLDDLVTMDPRNKEKG